MSDARIVSGTLASNCYPATPQELLNEWASKSSAQWPNVVGIVVSDTTPVATDRDKLWIKTNAGNVQGRFIYAGGRWHWPHEVPASGSERRLWVGSEAALDTYDGGSAGTAATDTGPFWAVDHDFDGRSPMGPGAIASANPAKTLGVSENYGEGAHTQTGQEVGPHTHEPSPKIMAASPGSSTISGIVFGGTGNAMPDLTVLANTYTSGQQAFNVVHPVRGVFIIKRTARVNRLP